MPPPYMPDRHDRYAVSPATKQLDKFVNDITVVPIQSQGHKLGGSIKGLRGLYQIRVTRQMVNTRKVLYGQVT